MLAFVAPSGWRVKVLAFHRLAAAAPLHLVLRVIAPGAANPLDIGAIFVVRHTAGAVAILNLGVIGVTAGAVEGRGWLERREERGEGREGVRWARRDLREQVCVQRFGRDGRDERVERFGRRFQCMLRLPLITGHVV